MAQRLSVVMVHSPPASLAASQLAEAIVGELIGLREIDLTLIGPIDQLAEGSSDRLSLESLSGDVALLDWQPPSAIIKSLATLNFVGSRSPHASDPHAGEAASSQKHAPPQPSTRRIYAFDLSQFSQPKAVCDALVRLKGTRQVRTFDLAPTLGGKTSPIGGNEGSQRPGALPVTQAPTSQASTSGAQSPPTGASQNQSPPEAGNEMAEPKSATRFQQKPGQKSETPAGSDSPSQVKQPDQLDALIDQLDQLDP